MLILHTDSPPLENLPAISLSFAWIIPRMAFLTTPHCRKSRQPGREHVQHFKSMTRRLDQRISFTEPFSVVIYAQACLMSLTQHVTHQTMPLFFFKVIENLSIRFINKYNCSQSDTRGPFVKKDLHLLPNGRHVVIISDSVLFHSPLTAQCQDKAPSPPPSAPPPPKVK